MTAETAPVTAAKGVPLATLRVFAVGCFSLAAISRDPVLAATAAGVGLVIMVWSLSSRLRQEDSFSCRWAGLVVVVLLLLRLSGFVGGFGDYDRSTRPVWLGLLLLAAVTAIVSGQRTLARRVSVVSAVIAVTVSTVGLVAQEWRAELALDVYWMHRQAGEALFDGENPYTDAVRVSNGSPFAPEGAVIEGYPYTPVVLGTYGVAGAVAEPRVVSAVVWLAVVAWLAWAVWRSGHRADTTFAMFLLVAGAAMWPVVLFGSWTEPLSIGLLVLAGIWWRPRPVLSAIMLGLALASKQYFIFLAPLVLLHRDGSRRMRVSVAFGVAGLTLLVGLVPDPSAFVDATFTNLSEIGFRPDTQSLSGLLASLGVEFFLAPAAWIAAGLLATTIVALRSETPSDFLARASLAIGIAFFIGSAFINYWFLLVALTAAATALGAMSADRGGADLSRSGTTG